MGVLPADLDWLFWLLGGFLAAAGVTLAAWALFWDRAKRGGVVRRRCPRCWYDMERVPGLTCPECGRCARSERGLFKTRRRWLAVPVAVFLVLGGYAATLAPVAIRDGWRRAMPTSVLVFVAPMRDSA